MAQLMVCLSSLSLSLVNIFASLIIYPGLNVSQCFPVASAAAGFTVAQLEGFFSSDFR